MKHERYNSNFVNRQTLKQGRRRNKNKRRAVITVRMVIRHSQHPRNEKFGEPLYFSKTYVILGYEEARDLIHRMISSDTSKWIASRVATSTNDRINARKFERTIRKNNPTIIYTVCLSLFHFFLSLDQIIDVLFLCRSLFQFLETSSWFFLAT